MLQVSVAQAVAFVQCTEYRQGNCDALLKHCFADHRSICRGIKLLLPLLSVVFVAEG